VLQQVFLILEFRQYVNVFYVLQNTINSFTVSSAIKRLSVKLIGYSAAEEYVNAASIA